MKAYLIAYAVALLAFLLIDGLWLGLIAKGFYAEQLNSLLRKNLLLVPAVLFYLIYTAGIVIIAVRPAQVPVLVSHAAAYGALLGLLAYGTYNMTNLATLQDWPLSMSIVDCLWGTLLTAAVASVSAFAVQLLV